MTDKIIKVDLTATQKEAVLKYAGFSLMTQESKQDLANPRKKWIRFTSYELKELVGELSYHFNRCKGDWTFYLLDELISHLEAHQ